MNDWYNDPPEHPEPPEWYSLIEAALAEKDLPDYVRTHLEAAMRAADEAEAARNREQADALYEFERENHFPA